MLPNKWIAHEVTKEHTLHIYKKMKMSKIYPQPKSKGNKEYRSNEDELLCNIRLIICYLHQYFGHPWLSYGYNY